MSKISEDKIENTSLLCGIDDLIAERDRLKGIIKDNGHVMLAYQKHVNRLENEKAELKDELHKANCCINEYWKGIQADKIKIIQLEEEKAEAVRIARRHLSSTCVYCIAKGIQDCGMKCQAWVDMREIERLTDETLEELRG